jgi:hypothetical protein
VQVACLWSCLDVSLFAGLLVITETKVLTQLMLKCPKTFGDDCFYVDVKGKHAFYGAFISVFFSYGVCIADPHAPAHSKGLVRCVRVALTPRLGNR